MIRIADEEDGYQIYSVSGQIEFLIYYNRIKHLVDFYNYTMKCYYNFLDQKHREREEIEVNIEEILKSAEKDEINVTKQELYFSIDEEILGIEMNYLEYQKMTLIIIMFSEVEKLIDNLCGLNQKIERRVGINIKLESLCKNKGLSKEDTNHILDNFNNLRLIRNKLIHRYDHWDDELVIGGRIYKGVEQLNDVLLEHLVNCITDSIKKLEEGYK